MQLHIHIEQDTYLIILKGDLDASSSLLVDEAIHKALQVRCKQILIDCDELKYISSAGLGVFMSYLVELQEQNIHLILYGLSVNVRDIFSMVGLDKLISIASSKNAAYSLCNAKEPSTTASTLS